MKMAVVDTHTVIWALLRPELLSQQAKDNGQRTNDPH